MIYGLLRLGTWLYDHGLWFLSEETGARMAAAFTIVLVGILGAGLAVVEADAR